MKPRNRVKSVLLLLLQLSYLFEEAVRQLQNLLLVVIVHYLQLSFNLCIHVLQLLVHFAWKISHAHVATFKRFDLRLFLLKHFPETGNKLVFTATTRSLLDQLGNVHSLRLNVLFFAD